MKTEVAKLLGVTLDNYEGIIFNSYNKWCAIYSKNSEQYQGFLNNQKIFNWFQTQIEIHEIEFLTDIDDYKLETSDNLFFYYKCIEKIYNHWPQPLGVKKPIPTSIKLLIKSNLN